MARYVRKEFNLTSLSFTTPAGVTNVKLSVIDKFDNMFTGSRNAQTSMVLRRTGVVSGTGQNTGYEIGLGASAANVSSLNATIGGQSFVQLSTSGNGVSVALRSDGATYGWGPNSYNSTGDGTATFGVKTSPVLVVGSHSFIQLSTGADSSYGLKANGEAWAWGAGSVGQIGNNTTSISVSSPVQVVGGHSFCKLTALGSTAVGLKVNGSVWTWGEGTAGQLANGQNGATAKASTPIQAIGGHSFIDIAAGLLCAYGIKSDGTIWGWGDNTTIPGILGDGSLTSKSEPTQVAAGFSFTQFSVGGAHALGLRADGTLVAWGWNNFGQLGDGTRVNKSTPVAVIGGHSFVQVGASNCSWAAKVDGSVWNWGGNATGQLGDATVLPKSFPVQLAGALPYQAGSTVLFEANLNVVPGTTYNLSAFLTQIGTQVITNFSTGNDLNIVLEYYV
jgi:alpha-tubulin suppressor-like RCC1 family protein